jgi:hypothetical protein
VLQFFVEQVVQAPEVAPALPLPEPDDPTLKQESNFVTFLDEQEGHLIVSLLPPKTRSSKVLLHLQHSYSNMGKVIPPTALPTIS